MTVWFSYAPLLPLFVHRWDGLGPLPVALATLLPSLLPIIYNAPTIYNVDRRERAGQGAGRAGQGRPPGGQLQEASLSLRGHLQLFRAELVELAGRRGDLVLPPVGNNKDEGQDGCEGNEETHVE